MNAQKINIVFVIRSIEGGGAQRQVIGLIKGLDKTQFDIALVTFYDTNTSHSELNALGDVRWISLSKQGRWDLLPFFWRLWKTARLLKPQILHGYMGISNELCLLIGRLVKSRVVWGLRASYVDFSQYDWASRWSFRLSAWLSRYADLIIVNSQAGKVHYLAHGYKSRRMVVIPNGIDTERFHPDLQAGQQVRAKWGVPPNTQLIGLVGRLDPIKDHPTFLQAAALLTKTHQDVRCVCVGGGGESYLQELQTLARQLGLEQYLIWTGPYMDMPAGYSAMDVVVSSSYGEGFSNVIAEAMACEVPCVVTDVGDSAFIVGDTGIVVPPQDAKALAVALCKLLRYSARERRKIGSAARVRIVSQFTREQLVHNTTDALLKLMDTNIRTQVNDRSNYMK